MIDKPARFERSPDTDLLMAALRKCAVGEVIDYKALSAAISRDVQESAHGNLTSARRNLESQEGIVFECVQNVGLRRLDDAGKVKSSKSKLLGMHRTVRRVGRRLGTVDISKLDEPTKRDFDSTATMAGVLDVMTSSRGVKRVEAAVAQAQQKLPLASTLQEFLK